jgi:hypothetical protein
MRYYAGAVLQWRRCSRAIFLIRAARDDLERIVRQRSLQSLRLIPRRAHPHVVF